jgi:DNA-directed RNA polymerase subunit E'/Rpb7
MAASAARKHRHDAANANANAPVLDAGCFVRSLVRDAIIVKPDRLGSNIREVLLRALRTHFEGICSRHGYILPGSIELVRVSAGRCEGASLNGDVRYEVQYQADVCNPGIGTVVSARVVNMNRVGILAHAGVYRREDVTVASVPVLEIVISKTSAELQSEVDLESVQIGDVVNVEIMGKKLELNQREIKVLGRLVKRSPAAVGRASVAPPQLGNEDAAAAAQEAAAAVDERVLALAGVVDDDDLSSASDASEMSAGSEDGTDDSGDDDDDDDAGSHTSGSAASGDESDGSTVAGGKKKASKAAPSVEGEAGEGSSDESSSDAGDAEDEEVDPEAEEEEEDADDSEDSGSDDAGDEA